MDLSVHLLIKITQLTKILIPLYFNIQYFDSSDEDNFKIISIADKIKNLDIESMNNLRENEILKLLNNIDINSLSLKIDSKLSLKDNGNN